MGFDESDVLTVDVTCKGDVFENGHRTRDLTEERFVDLVKLHNISVFVGELKFWSVANLCHPHCSGDKES